MHNRKLFAPLKKSSSLQHLAGPCRNCLAILHVCNDYGDNALVYCTQYIAVQYRLNSYSIDMDFFDERLCMWSFSMCTVQTFASRENECLHIVSHTV